MEIGHECLKLNQNAFEVTASRHIQGTKTDYIAGRSWLSN
jgi:hypothetical protein